MSNNSSNTKENKEEQYANIKKELSDVARSAAIKGASEGVSNAIADSENKTKISIVKSKLESLKKGSWEDEFKFVNAYDPEQLANVKNINNKENKTDQDFINIYDQLNDIGIKEDRMGSLYKDMYKVDSTTGNTGNTGNTATVAPQPQPQPQPQSQYNNNNNNIYDFGRSKSDNYNIGGINVPVTGSKIDDLSDRYAKNQSEIDDVCRRGLTPATHKNWSESIKKETNAYRDDEGKKVFLCATEESIKLGRDLDPKSYVNWASDPEVLSRKAYDDYHRIEPDFSFESDCIDEINIGQANSDKEIQDHIKGILRHEFISPSKVIFPN